ncbi:MAG: nitrate reductase molybdenum cofactor assembly chaperone [Oceanibaculum nanhaiense]|uniref:nitrate reductase molybdenum cofactor assembly chaperone n=1 Tax=Oceanibaculum nanhaiense TaxID=1909734 RepID=UPI0025A4B52C|nr:nitrate reductase molybdenum cofactor assembly chaperone [Oceanibaculum nanhaiense]MDM7946714.1 nitrate reductase molybdenum cofactor assembly chaperone [Oceanibaculum nanhaiense]
MKSFKALSALLNYPSAEFVAAMPEIRAVLAGEGLVPRSSLKALEPLLSSFETAELYDLQERYVLLFDRSRSLSLHLFEHVHGESRDRGQALVDLSQLYDKNGFFIVANELPDFLPLFLEFLSTLPFGEATALLGETVHILAVLRQRLEKRESPYAALFAAVEALSAVRADPRAAAEAAASDVMPDDLAALDREWEEAAVTFGPGEMTDDCSLTRIKTQVRAARRSPDAPAA